MKSVGKFSNDLRWISSNN